MEVRRSEVLGHPWLHSKIKTSLEYVRLCLKNKEKERNGGGEAGGGWRRREDGKDGEREEEREGRVCSSGLGV